MMQNMQVAASGRSTQGATMQLEAKASHHHSNGAIFTCDIALQACSLADQISYTFPTQSTDISSNGVGGAQATQPAVITKAEAPKPSYRQLLQEIEALIADFSNPNLTAAQEVALLTQLIAKVSEMNKAYPGRINNLLNILGDKFAYAIFMTIILKANREGNYTEAFELIDQVYALLANSGLGNLPMFQKLEGYFKSLVTDPNDPEPGILELLESYTNKYIYEGNDPTGANWFYAQFFDNFFSDNLGKILAFVTTSLMKYYGHSLTEIVFIFMYNSLQGQNYILSFQGVLMNLLTYINNELSSLLGKFNDNAPNKPGQQTGNWPSDGNDATQWAENLLGLQQIVQANSGMLGKSSIGSAVDDINDILNKLINGTFNDGSGNQTASLAELLAELNGGTGNPPIIKQEIAALLNQCCYPSTAPIPPPGSGSGNSPQQITYEQINQNFKAMISLFSDQGQQVQLQVQENTTNYNNMYNDSASILSSINDMLKAFVQNQKVS